MYIYLFCSFVLCWDICFDQHRYFKLSQIPQISKKNLIEIVIFIPSIASSTKKKRLHPSPNAPTPACANCRSWAEVAIHCSWVLDSCITCRVSIGFQATGFDGCGSGKMTKHHGRNGCLMSERSEKLELYLVVNCKFNPF